jgi:hypothetical protein
VITKVPNGFGRFPSWGGPPCLDLQAATNTETAAYRRALKADGFIRGYERLWLNARTDLIDVLLYQFATDSGARIHATRASSAAKNKQPGATAFDVPGVPGATGLVAINNAGTVAVVITHVGRLFVAVSCGGKDRSRAQAAAEQAVHFAQQQYVRL